MIFSKKAKIYSLSVFFASLFFSFFFFLYLHPLAVLDFDDWSYISGFRIPLPVPTFWNPSRILPECLMPFCGFCGSIVYRVFPSIEYVRSLSLSIAFFLSFFIATYVLQFYRYVNIKLKISSFKAILLTGIFISLHFLIYRVSDTENQYAYMPGSVTGCFFYIIPVLFNASLVLFFESSDIASDFFSKRLTFSKIVFLLAIYFSVFSNLFGSIIIASYASFKVLNDLLKKEPDFIKHDSIYILVLFLWFIAVIFEGMGGRAGLSNSFKTCIQMNLDTLCRNIVSNIKSINLLFYIFLAFALVLCGIKKCRDFSAFYFSAILTACFLFLLCIKVNPRSVLLPQVRFGFVFFLLVIMAGSFSDLKEALLVIILSLSIFFSCSSGKTYADSLSYGGMDSYTAISVSQNCVDQITAADKAGYSSVEMHVFDSTEDADNWPQTFGIGLPIGRALLRHGIISRDIEITVFVDSSLNTLYNIF